MSFFSFFSPKVLIFLLFLTITTTQQLSLSTDVHDILPKYNLPKGILPRNIKSYSISESDNTFTVELDSHPCYVKYNDQVVYYDRIVKGKLEYGKVSAVSGIQAKKYFLWVSVTGMDVDEKNGVIVFHVGALSQQLPAKDFDAVHSCKAKGLSLREMLTFQPDAFI